MRIVYLSLAVSDLAEIHTYITAQNPGAAQLVGHKLRESIEILKRFPNLGKSARVFGTHELFTPKIGKTIYIVIYRVRKDDVQILRVLAGMRDINTILEEDFGKEEV